MLKISKYNHFLERPDRTYLAYNAVSGALAMMLKENMAVYNQIKKKLTTETDPVFNEKEQELVKQLEYASFVYSGEYDEVDKLSFTHRQARHDSSSLGFVLAPTMACNMACEYCYEENKQGRMTADTIEAIVNFIKDNGREIKEVSISWYGGEPLLAMDIIEELTNKILEFGKEYGFSYTASIITNGYLLDKETVDKLVSLKVKSAQITLDGPAHVHNKVRPLKNGRLSYKKIIQNLIYATTKLNTSIRVNIDKKFTSELVLEMLEDLEEAGLKERASVYFGQIEASTSACANISESCFNVADYSEIETKFFKLISDKGFAVTKLPSPMSNYCVAQSVSGFVMDHDGNLYRCFNYIGDHSRITGNIKDGVDYFNRNFLEIFKFDPFEKELCRNCEILPICMGGCPARRMDGNLPEEEMCASWKYNLPEMLELIALSRQRQMESARKE